MKKQILESNKNIAYILHFDIISWNVSNFPGICDATEGCTAPEVCLQAGTANANCGM